MRPPPRPETHSDAYGPLDTRHEYILETRIHRMRRRARILGRFPASDEVLDLFTASEYRDLFGMDATDDEYSSTEF